MFKWVMVGLKNVLGFGDVEVMFGGIGGWK